MTDLQLRPRGPVKGDTLFGFECVRAGRYGGAYGNTYTGARWRCQTCGTSFHGDPSKWVNERLYRHMDQGHSPCSYCGKQLLNRKDGSPRQHSANQCPEKNEGHKIEREFVKNIAVREYT